MSDGHGDDRPAGDAEAYLGRVERTLAFIDLSGFTEFTATRGDADAVTLLARFRRVVREAAARRSVRIAKWLGDGAMLASADTTLVVLTVFDVDDEVTRTLELPLRSGLATGRVILFEGDDYIGGAVNLASRLSDLAGPGEVVSDVHTADLAEVVASREPLGAVPVEGLAEPVEIVRLTPRVPPGDGPDVGSGSHGYRRVSR